MLDIKNPVQAYEVFKLQWMIEHVATLSDLVHNLQLMLDEDLNVKGVILEGNFVRKDF